MRAKRIGIGAVNFGKRSRVPRDARARLLGAAVCATIALSSLFSASASAEVPSFLWQTPEDVFAGDGAGEVDHPQDLVADPESGHLFVVDLFNSRVSELTPWGEFVKAWGWGVRDGAAEPQTCGPGAAPPTIICRKGIPGAGPGQFGQPVKNGGPVGGVVLDTAGNVYVGDMENFRVEKYDPDGNFLLMFGGEVNKTTGADVCTAASGDLCGEGVSGEADGFFTGGRRSYIVAGPAGTIFVGDRNGRIQEFETNGAFKAKVMLEAELGVWRMVSLEMDAAGNFYVVRDGDRKHIYKFGPTGALLLTITTVLAPESPLAVDADGNIYAVHNAIPGTSEPNVYEIIEFAPDGKPLAPIGSGFALQPKPGGLSKQLVISGLATNTVSGDGKIDVYASISAAETYSATAAYGPAPDLWTAPLRPPAIFDQYASSVGVDNATLRAHISPRFWADTTYEVEYGPAKCSEADCAATEPTVLGADSVNTPVTTKGLTLTDLAPATTYHYRFIAQSTGGGPVRGAGGKPGEDGAEGTFTTFALPEPPSAECGNQAYRTGAGAYLPDCRAYEMVSPLEKGGGDILVKDEPTTGLPATLDQSANSGDRLAYGSEAAFSGAEAGPYTNQYIAERGEAGWSTHPISALQGAPVLEPPHLEDAEFKAFSPDLCQSWLRSTSEPPLAEGAVPGYPNLYRRTDSAPGCGGTSYEALTRTAPPDIEDPRRYAPLKFQIASADGQAALYVAPDKLTAEAPAASSEECLEAEENCPLRLYHVQDGAIRYVCVLPNGTPSPLGCVAGTGGSMQGLNKEGTLTNAISADGSRVFFSTYLGISPGVGKLYLRLNPGQPQSAMTHGVASGTGSLASGSDKVTSLVAAAGKVSFASGSKEATLLETTTGKFVAGQPLTALGKVPAGTTIASVSGATLTLSAAATGSGVGNVSSRGPMPFEVGQTISAPGIPPKTTIVEAKGGELRLSQAATGSATVPLSAFGECSEAAKACTIAISAEAEELAGSSSSRYWTAAADGSLAVLETNGGLYEYDIDSQETTLIAAESLGVMGASEDASRVYFASEEVLASANPQGNAPQAGARNLYLYEAGEGEGSYRFVAQLTATDLSETLAQAAIARKPHLRTSRVTPDGLHAAFMSTGSPTGYDNLDAASEEPDAEVYRYEAAANGGEGALACVSCNPSGSRPTGREVNPSEWAAAQLPVWQTELHASRVLSGDGSRLFFNSFDALSARDSNGAQDVYEWEAPGTGGCTEESASYSPPNEGCLYLISSGEGEEDTELIDADPAGENAFIRTSEGLLAKDTGEEADIYDARVEGGFEADIVKFALIVAKKGGGTGKVTSEPAGIECGGTCEAEFEEGTEVTLSAVSNEGSEFKAWEGCDSEAEGKCIVTLDEAREATATFEEEAPEGIPLSIETEGGGSGTVASDKGAISCSPFCEDEYAEGTKVTLTATPTPGSAFYSWKRCDAGGVNGRQCMVSMDKAKTVTAVFATTHELTVTKEGGLGKVQSSPGGILCLANCSETTAAFLEGAKVTLKATPSKRFVLAEWTGDCSGTGTCELTMSEDHAVGAKFTEVPRHSLTLTKAGGGAGTVKSDPAGLNCGLTCVTQASSFYEGKVTLAATPGKGSALAGWSGGGCAGKGTCEVTIGAATEVKAEFK